MPAQQYLDIDNWSRREQYYFFKAYENPFFNICTMLNIKNLLTYCKDNSIPLSHAYFYLSQKAVNEVSEMRYRIHNDKVVIHDHIDAGWVMMKEDGSIRFCYLHYTTEFDNFRAQIEEITRNIEDLPFDSNEQRDDLVYYSVLPWIHFTGLSHAHRMPRNDSVPRIVFGKYKQQEDEVNMPVAVEVHHALMDGFHVAQYLEKLQRFFDGCGDFLV
ncbi:chloramphenicol acetyltransferase [Candidatus Uabimicrobium amorphum]|uniref:Chloramphenicol acetyltransferase n=1 Tax=Uabimicrobium amorphum TaxID=2596890 RepID=A0A5S9IMK3_UABAM|nr:chloramphenicol acetyltransferase [Candidatus Uabimicrobium amorphum]BBM83810.1 chloramphenicol acetyltransferase [Candidatus Uabimicrobium amorphum]